MKRREVEFTVTDADSIVSALHWVRRMATKGLGSGPVAVRLGRPRRSLDQNSKLWPLCEDISRQVPWHGQWLKKDDWKDLFVGSWRGQTPLPGINGGVVFIGGGSSKLNKAEFSELLEMIQAFGTDHEVEWSNESKGVFKNDKS